MSVHVVRGDDPILRIDVLDALVAELVGDDDRTLAVEDFTVPGKAADGEATAAEARQAVVAAAVNAAQSPPFMTARRVVVMRDIGLLTAEDVAPLVACIADLLDTTDVVFVVGGGRVPDALSRSWKALGATEHTARAKAEDLLHDALAAAGLSLRPDAARAVVEHVGTEAGRIPAIVELLASAFGPGARLHAEDVTPYLGERGGVAPWMLTKAIEAGDVAAALDVLHRLLTATGPQQPKPMHPLQILAMLHNSVRRTARLDAPDVGSADEAIAALGGKVSPFVAKQALAHARRLGTDGIRDAYTAIAQADLDLKGARAIPEDVVMEVLVTRLAALAARSGAPGAGRRSGGRGSGRGRR